MNTEADQQLRFECLELAVQMQAPELARGFYEFVTGQSDASPREKIDEALDAADVR